MIPKTVMDKILYYLQTQPGWVTKSELERQSMNWGTGADNIDRRARQLAQKGEIERTLSERRTTLYRYPHKEVTLL